MKSRIRSKTPSEAKTISKQPSRRKVSPSKARICLTLAVLLGVTSGCRQSGEEKIEAAVLEKPATKDLARPGEVRLANVTQLTFDGENAEAYFSPDATELIFQATREGLSCDQIFRMDIDGRNKRLVSTGTGRTTCSFIFPNQPKILYSSTHATMTECPPRPDYSRGYVWRLQPELDIFVAGPDGQDPIALAPHPGYDAEGVVSPQGDRILFTSTRSGDVDIYSMAADGSDVKQLTTEVGYDGGAFFSLDGTKIVYRAHHPTDKDALDEYKKLLADDLVRPSIMELFVMDADGSNKRQITNNGAANFAPYFHPDGKRIIFSSNMDDPSGRNFDLYMIGVDGKNLERITFEESFDSFPMFSYDGKKLVFASNRNAKNEGDTNVFVADWVEQIPIAKGARLRGQAQIDPETYSQRIGRLASEEMGGRAPGTPGGEKAAEYLTQHFQIAGLVEVDGAKGYRQTFEVPDKLEITSANLSSTRGALVLGETYSPTIHSASGKLDAEAVHVGHGVRAPELGHDDYKGLSLEGKIAVIASGAPANLEAKDLVRHTDPVNKALTARAAGAKAVIFLDPMGADSESAPIKKLEGPASPVGLVTMRVTEAGAKALFPEGSLGENAPGKSLGKLSLEANIKESKRAIDNIVGRLPAREDGKPTQRALVVGAHFDHLGLGGDSSLRPGEDAVHFGADDNASGVAMMLELAEALGGIEREHDIYFVAFNAEESGLLGSEYFAQNPPILSEYIISMINLDMVGRLDNGSLELGGVGSAKEFLDLARRVQARTSNTAALDLDLSFEGYGPSDHMSFYVRQIPVLSIHTGLHDAYHTPDDTLETIDIPGSIRVAVFTFELIAELANTSRAPTFQQAEGTGGAAHASHGSKDRGYGPYFGSIPGFGKGDDIKGARLMGAKPGSPAEKAGIQKGDVIIKFGEYDVTSLRDYAFALRQHKPGDTVKLVVVREGKEVTLEATLTEKDK